MSATADASGQSVTVTRAEEKNRYEVRVEGELAGIAAYRDRGDQRVFYHTEVKKAFGGRGLSSLLIGEALADVRSAGKLVVAVCPFVSAYLGKHPEFGDIARPVNPDMLQWLESVLG
jgi:predicted GNAT family acetyltransferase